MSTVADRVARGVALLDAHYGPTWVERIDLGILEMSSSCDCILGQLEGSFWKGIQVKGLQPPTRPDFDETFAASGFDINGDVLDDELAAKYAELESEWRRVIAERRAVAS